MVGVWRCIRFLCLGEDQGDFPGGAEMGKGFGDNIFGLVMACTLSIYTSLAQE